MYRRDYTFFNTAISLLTTRYAYQADDVSSPVAVWKCESSKSQQWGVLQYAGAPEKRFLNLLFGELYPWKEHRGTGIDIVILALQVTCKVRMFYWDRRRFGCHVSSHHILALAWMSYGTSDIFKLCVYVVILTICILIIRPNIKLRGLSPHANYTDRAAAAGRRS